jgi:hypothetical protein
MAIGMISSAFADNRRTKNGMVPYTQVSFRKNACSVSPHEFKTQSSHTLGDVDIESNAYWRVINRAEVLILRGDTKEAIALYHHAAGIATTPNELKSALDNLTYMMERMPQLDGVQAARKHLYETRQRIQIVE